MNRNESYRKHTEAFSKNFVESPLLESFDAGKLVITTGEIVASDPLITPDKEAFDQQFPTGNLL